MITSYIVVTFGYYTRSRTNPTKLVYIQPKRIKSFDELRMYHSMGAALYNKEGAFFVNEILDTSISNSSDESENDAKLKPETSSANKTSAPSATISKPIEDNPEEDTPGQIELVDTSNDDYVEVSDENPDTDFSEQSDSNLPDVSQFIATRKSTETSGTAQVQEGNGEGQEQDETEYEPSNLLLFQIYFSEL